MITKDSLSTLKQVEIAALLGLTERRIQQLHAEGLPRNGEGRGGVYVWPSVLAWWTDRISGSREGGDESSKSRKEAAEADMAEMKRDALAGTLLDAEDVRTTWAEALANMRAKMLTMPSKGAVQMEDGQTLAEREAILQAVVDEALAELAGRGTGGADA